MSTKRVDLRLDVGMWDAVEGYRRSSGIDTPSEAIRSLIDVALRDMPAIDAAFRKAAWREGMKKGAVDLRAKLDEAVAKSTGAL